MPRDLCVSCCVAAGARALRSVTASRSGQAHGESEQAEVVRFRTDDGESRGCPVHYLTVIHYSARLERLLITWSLGTLVIAGPKVLEFYDDFLQSPGNFSQGRRC